MSQLSLYLDEASMKRLRDNAARAGESISSYARHALEADRGAWPSSFWSTYGALQDDSFVLADDIDESYDRPLPCFD